MKTASLFSPLRGSLLFAGLILLGGCADSTFAPESDQTTEPAPLSSKMKHAHLYGGTFADGANAVDLVDYVHNGGTAAGLSFVGDDAQDDPGHGTHVSGTAAAVDNDHGVTGVASGVRVHNLKVLNDRGWTELSTVIAAVEYITELKWAFPERKIVAIISFGADVGTTEYNALDEAVASSIEQGVVFEIAAGNEGIDASTVPRLTWREQ